MIWNTEQMLGAVLSSRSTPSSSPSTILPSRDTFCISDFQMRRLRYGETEVIRFGSSSELMAEQGVGPRPSEHRCFLCLCSK